MLLRALAESRIALLTAMSDDGRDAFELYYLAESREVQRSARRDKLLAIALVRETEDSVESNNFRNMYAASGTRR